MTVARPSSAGAAVLYHARQQQPVDPVVRQIRAQGGVACACEVDLSHADTIPVLFDCCRPIAVRSMCW